MDHERYRELMKKDMNNNLGEEEKKELQNHLEGCESCRKEQEELKNKNETLQNNEDLNPNENFKEKNTKKRWRDRMKKFTLKQYFLFGAGIIILVIVVGSLFTNSFINMGNRGSDLLNKEPVSDFNQGITGESSAKDQASNELSPETASETANSEIPFDITKIIYSGNISLYTDDYQGTFEKIGQYAVGLGGFVQNTSSSFASEDQNILADTGYITIRVPAEKFTQAMEELLKYGTPISSSINSTNISQQYQDIKGQLDNLKIQEARLLEYLSKAENVNDMLLIESELNRVKTEIDNRSTMINNWDKEISYSTIYVSLYERELSTSAVKSPFSNMLTQISEGFIASINLILNILGGLIVWIFRLLPFAAVLGLGYLIYIRIRKKK